MANELFPNVFKQSQVFLGPWVKANQRIIADVEKLLHFQLDAWQSYVNMGMDRLKDATEIRDPESLQRFVSDQFEVAGTLARKLVEDAQTLIGLTAGVRDDLDELVRETATELSETTAKATPEIKEAARKKA